METAGVVVVAGAAAGAVAGAGVEGAGADAGAVSGGGVSRPEGWLLGAGASCARAPGVSMVSSAPNPRAAAAAMRAKQMERRFMVDGDT